MTNAYLGPPRRRRDPSPVIVDQPRGLPAEIQPPVAEEVVLPSAPGARDLGDPALSRRARANAAAAEAEAPEVEPPGSFPSFDRSHERSRRVPIAAPEPEVPSFDLPAAPGGP